MFLCQSKPDFAQTCENKHSHDWSLAAYSYPELMEMPSFIAQQRQDFSPKSYPKADPSTLQGEQLRAYKAVHNYLNYTDNSKQPLRMVVCGTAGTGKSYLIHCITILLGDHLCVAAPTGVAAFNVHGHTLHSLLCLPT